MPYKDPEMARAAARRYRLDNPEKFAARDRLWKLNNPEKVKASNKRWRADNPEKVAAAMRRHDLKRHYGLTAGEYEILLENQKGVCALCHEPEKSVRNGNIMRLHVDHDHITGRLRALLCSLCNTSLGGLRDRPELTLRAYGYLMFWREHHEKLEADSTSSENLLTS